MDTRVDAYLPWIASELERACDDEVRVWCDIPGILTPGEVAGLELSEDGDGPVVEPGDLEEEPAEGEDVTGDEGPALEGPDGADQPADDTPSEADFGASSAEEEDLALTGGCAATGASNGLFAVGLLGLFAIRRRR